MHPDSRLHHALSGWLEQAADWSHRTHLSTCGWMLVALMQTNSVNLTDWLRYLPGRARQAQSKQRRLHRWLHNPRINPHRLYARLIRMALANWQDECLYLSFDTSLFWEEFCLVRLAVVHRGRAIPVIWRVLRHASASVSFEDYQSLLAQARSRLPQAVKIILLADRGFVHTQLMEQLAHDWGWHYRIRLKRNSWIWRRGRGWQQLSAFHLGHGEALKLHHVYLHKDQRYGPVHLLVGRNGVNGEFWALVSDEPTRLHTFAEYGLRFDIEESFLDDQSNGWNVQRSKIRSVAALSRLWFVLALATLYLTAQGVDVVERGRRRWVDPHWFRGQSYLRIGLEWVHTALRQGWRLLRQVRLLTHDDPDLAKASHLQHRRQKFRFEFQLSTLNYAPR